jgi:hypothetical protein
MKSAPNHPKVAMQPRYGLQLHHCTLQAPSRLLAM